MTTEQTERNAEVIRARSAARRDQYMAGPRFTAPWITDWRMARPGHGYSPSRK